MCPFSVRHVGARSMHNEGSVLLSVWKGASASRSICGLGQHAAIFSLSESKSPFVSPVDAWA